MNVIPNKLGRYQIIRELGRGAMGVVYKAHDPIIEREVAIKAIHLAFPVSSDDRQVYFHRFYREAKAAGKLNHPNIVTIYDVDEDKETSTPFIVMEYLEGTTLQEIVSNGMLLPIEDTSNIIMQVADALTYAHHEGIVHRDIKTANVLILRGMKAKIMDFGIARMESSELTRSGQYVGTPNYMSPEQVSGNGKIDGRSDLFSLGVIFYLLLTGERPFTGETFTSISYKIAHVEPIPPRSINASIPEPYSSIVTRLLAKDPAQRYQTGAELVADLKRAEGTATAPEEYGMIEGEYIAPAAGEQAAVPTPTPATRGNSTQAIPEPQDVSVKRLGIVAGMIVFAAVILFAGIYFFQKRPDPEKTQVGVVPNQAETTKAISNQNVIRSKWDLAMNYYQNGRYDQSIEKFNEILKIDPNFQDAAKFRDLAEEKKKAQQAQSAASTPVASSSVPDKPKPAVKQAARKSNSTAVPPAVIPGKPAEPVVEEASYDVHFIFEHALATGSLTIYTGDKKLFEGPLSVKKSKFLMFSTTKGLVDGTFRITTNEKKL
ncbi:MAG TPA: protein kinase, partial [Acidobacteriota bacterium]|nr:protein kinase [Acidobacteriota bacterium]